MNPKKIFHLKSIFTIVTLMGWCLSQIQGGSTKPHNTCRVITFPSFFPFSGHLLTFIAKFHKRTVTGRRY